MIELLFALVIFYFTFKTGQALLGRRIKFSGSVEEVCFSLGMGFIAIAYATLTLGILNLLYKEIVFLLVALLALVLLPSIIRDVKGMKRSILAWKKKIFSIPGKSVFAWIVLVLLLCHVAVQLLSSLSPPAAYRFGPMDWDSLTYHFTMPNLYAKFHKEIPLPFVPHVTLPTLFERIHLLSILLYNETVARVLSVLLSVAVVVATYSLSRKFFSKETSILAAAIFYAAPVVNTSLGTGYVDLPLTFFALVALTAFHNWSAMKKDSWLWLAAMLAGAAVATKLIGAAVVVLLAAFVFHVALLKQKKPLMHTLRKTILFSLIPTLFLSPWLLKTYYYTGNPVWPLYHESFSFFGFSDGAAQRFTANWNYAVSRSGMGHSLSDLLLLPWNLTMHGREFNGAVTPLFLALIPLLLLSKARLPTRFLLTFALLYLVAWFFLLWQETRFLFLVFPLLSIVAATALENIDRKTFAIKAIQALIISVLLANLGLLLIYKYNSFGVALGLESRDHYLTWALDNYAACSYAASKLPTDAKIFMYNDDLGYYCDREPVYAGIFFTYYDANGKNAEWLYGKLHSVGVGYVLENNVRAMPKDDYSKQTRHLMTEFFSVYAEKVFEANGVVLYQLR